MNTLAVTVDRLYVRCSVCNRVMAEHECGDETDEGRVCDECVEITRHLVRYLVNRTERTGTQWLVIERYSHTPRDYHHRWLRALIEDADGNQVRIYYRNHSKCWAVS